MARKIIIANFLILSFLCLKSSLNATNLPKSRFNTINYFNFKGIDTLTNSPSLRSSKNGATDTHLGLGLSPGFNNTYYLKFSHRFEIKNLPLGFYQTVEYAAKHNLENHDSPLFFLPSGAYLELNRQWTILVGVDLLTKAIYSYGGIRKEIAVCYLWKSVPITLGYSYFMGPSVMIGIPVFK
jgi:hypothetical protein